MISIDHKILFTALAFVVVLNQREEIDSETEALRVTTLADLIEAFCLENIGEAMDEPLRTAR